MMFRSFFGEILSASAAEERYAPLSNLNLDSDEEVDAWIRASSHSGARVHPEWPLTAFFFGPVSSFQMMSCLGSLVICSLLLFCKGYVAKIGVSGKDVYPQYMFFFKGGTDEAVDGLGFS